MPPPVRSAEREGRPNHCGRRRRARMPIPSADGSAGTVRIFYCIQGRTAHNVRDNDVCVRCENKRGEPPNCFGRKCYERGCYEQRRCRQRRRGRKHHARMPIPPADGSAGTVRIFYCIRGGTEHNVRDNDVCVRCENKRGEPPNCCGRKCYERGCCGQIRCGQIRCRQRRRGRRRRARMPILPADGSAGAVRIFYCIRVETAHNVRSDGSCARREKKKGRGVSPSLQVLEYLSKEAVLRPSRVPPIKRWDITGTDNYYTF